MSELKGFFLFQAPRDLFEKLKRDFARMQTDPEGHDAALDFFYTAEHLIDWVYPGATNGPQRCQLRKTVPVLSIVSHIANGTKHFRADAPHHNSVLGESAVEAGVSFPMSVPIIFPVEDLAVDLGEAVLTFLGDPSRRAKRTRSVPLRDKAQLGSLIML